MSEWVRVVDGVVVASQARRPPMQRDDAGAWTTDLARLGWRLVERTPMPTGAWRWSGRWAVADGEPVWEWVRGDALPPPPRRIGVPELPADEVAGSLALLTQDVIELRAFAAVAVEALVSLGVERRDVEAAVGAAQVAARERLAEYQDAEWRRGQIADRIAAARPADDDGGGDGGGR